MDNLTERIAWAIETIKADKDLDKGIKDIDLAKKLGTNKDTLAGYRNRKGLLKGEVVERIVSSYHFSPVWLFQGQGEPFPGARQKYPEVCGPESVDQVISSSPRPTARSGASSTEPLGAQFRITDALTMCTRVLESGTSYATALYLNILHYDRAVSAEERISHLEANQASFEQSTQVRFRDMENKIDNLIAENKAKQAEINRLKATYEGPDGGRDSLTNTSGKG